MRVCLKLLPNVEHRTKGRPRMVGQRLPNLTTIIAQPTTDWQKYQADWYGGGQRQLELVTGTALWYSTGFAPLAIRWVIVRDPQRSVAHQSLFFN